MRRTIAVLFLLCGVAGAQAVSEAPSITTDMADGTLGGDIVSIYEGAVATMRMTCDDYRRIKALELSIRRDIPFREAYHNINDVMPELAPVDRDLLRRPVRRPEEIEPHRKEVQNVQTQVEMMIDLTAKLLEEIEKVEIAIKEMLEEKEEVTLEEIVQRPEFDPKAQVVQAEERQEAKQDKMKELVKLAKQDTKKSKEQKEFQDLTKVMREIMKTQKETKQQKLERKQLKAQPTFVSRNEYEKLKKVGRLEIKNSIFGRKVGAEGEPREWMFIDTWYTIGPFPNPSRVNLNRKFPPETVVDLDAVYKGKDGQSIRWEFVQSGELEVIPANAQEYGIWYAYTELWFDRDMDIWCAIGSDDKANVWVNDLPVWVSSDWLKGWRSDEGFRKVAFQAGRNRILYRVENGWKHVGFSFGLHVAE